MILTDMVDKSLVYENVNKARVVKAELQSKQTNKQTKNKKNGQQV